VDPSSGRGPPVAPESEIRAVRAKHCNRTEAAADSGDGSKAHLRNEKVRGSNPLSSTKLAGQLRFTEPHRGARRCGRGILDACLDSRVVPAQDNYDARIVHDNGQLRVPRISSAKPERRSPDRIDFFAELQSTGRPVGDLAQSPVS
jgi:hypothetical protein